jgi:hypothetical protein
MNRPCISLLTDFGLEDSYVGQVKGIIGNYSGRLDRRFFSRNDLCRGRRSGGGQRSPGDCRGNRPVSIRLPGQRIADAGSASPPPSSRGAIGPAAVVAAKVFIDISWP